jgi:hypothetical protein
VPGGRYREIYYWDSRWILEGLLQSELYVYAWDLLQNFMDLIDVSTALGHVPGTADLAAVRLLAQWWKVSILAS